MPAIESGGGPRPTVSIGTSESAALERAVAAAAEMAAAGEVEELPAGRRRDEHLARVRVRERGRGAHAAVGNRVEDRVVLVAVASHDDAAVLLESDDPGGRLVVETLGDRARIVRVDHRRAVRRGHEVVAGVEARDLVDVRLAVVGADDHGVALEERVRPAGGVEQRADRRVAALERLVRACRARRACDA